MRMLYLNRCVRLMRGCCVINRRLAGGKAGLFSWHVFLYSLILSNSRSL
jgi:hypothetical protein